MKTIVRLLMLTAILAVMGSAPAMASSAAAPPHLAKSSTTVSPAAATIQTFQNPNPGRCIDDPSGGFRTSPCKGPVAQQWRAHVFNGGPRRLQNVNTGRCMFDSNGGFRTVSPCDASTNQS